jgi:oligogalacturonide lyase
MGAPYARSPNPHRRLLRRAHSRARRVRANGPHLAIRKKIVPDPVTGLPLTFLTSTDVYHRSKIYQTQRQWTSDGKWLIFRGQRETGSEAMAVNEETGEIVQVTDNGFLLCLSNIAMKLYVLSGGGGRGQAPLGVSV